MKTFNTLSVREQAYLIVVALQGSWMYDVMYDQLEDEQFCQKLIKIWKDNERVGDADKIEEFRHGVMSATLTQQILGDVI